MDPGKARLVVDLASRTPLGLTFWLQYYEMRGQNVRLSALVRFLRLVGFLGSERPCEVVSSL